MLNRPITVEFARGQKDEFDRIEENDNGPPRYSVFMGNLAYDATTDIIKEMIDDLLEPETEIVEVFPRLCYVKILID